MCGIFGVIYGENSSFTPISTKLVINELFKLSESRGREASGMALLSDNTIFVGKYALPASEMIRRKEYKRIFKEILPENSASGNEKARYPISIIGHSRLVTNGGQQIHDNNQPVISSGMVGIHNGIVTNVDDLWAKLPLLERKYQVDTEVLLSLIRKFYHEEGSLLLGVQKTFRLIEGATSIAAYFDDLNNILLATNNGSIYLCSNKAGNAYIFASENYILQTLTRRRWLSHLLGHFEIRHVEPGTGCLINLENLSLDEFSLTSNGRKDDLPIKPLGLQKRIIDISPKEEIEAMPTKLPGEGPYILLPSFVDEYPPNREVVSRLRRCTKCVLPETMPFIEFDEEDVCNYCRNYKKIEPLGLDALMEVIDPYRKQNGKPECLVTFSGGRDSSYGVHFAKNVLKMNPITYTYDWGMVTDLARRNQMRICGKLGLEHILVSADIATKRKNIHKNVLAWLKKPDLGTVPLFMAGDKQFFYYANKVSKHTGCKIVILCENLLETTRFKSGFCGIAPDHGSRDTYTLAFFDKIKMAMYYGKQYLTNTAYANSSILDTISAYCSYYFIPHNYLNIFQYIKWNEEEINTTLINEYNWETATDTTTTWRIGDGTASFYNYIYYTMAGFTENDTFRSNQIREGMLTREKAMQLVERENEPRYESIQWYCDIIGVDFEETIKTINAAPKLYMC